MQRWADSQTNGQQNNDAAFRFTHRQAAWFAYVGMLVISLAGVLIVVGAPWLRAHGFEFMSGILYDALRPVCHQIPSRSFHYHEYPWALCSRCSALLIGGALGLLLVPIIRSLDTAVPKRHWLLIAAIPSAVDVAVGWLGIPNTFLSRTVTGGLLGSVTAFYLVPAMVAAMQELLVHRSCRQEPVAHLGQ